ncbi:hypothetical protein DFJ73DRAFT_874356 [Zopfochytrium polystomum]|nr:hypothetical protein DFJ73DRAFT_874356 [Zopfochytrium polystomum]
MVGADSAYQSVFTFEASAEIRADGTFTSDPHPVYTFCRSHYHEAAAANEAEVGDDAQTPALRVLRSAQVKSEYSGDYSVRRVLQCGICCTDLARPFLPYELPQIIGHEALIEVDDEHYGVVDINDSHFSHSRLDPLTGALAENEPARSCPYCNPDNPHRMPSQCPARTTMGINSWCGALAPYLIVPNRNLEIIPKSSLPKDVAALIEPFAAALHAVESRNWKGLAGKRGMVHVGVVGAGKLGLMILASLLGMDHPDVRLKVTAILRSIEHADRAVNFGCSDIILSEGYDSDGKPKWNRLVANGPLEPVSESLSFDIVFDTSGTLSGLSTALSVATQELHLKSTNGQPFGGLAHVTEAVVDEIAIIPVELGSPSTLDSALSFSWPNGQRSNPNIVTLGCSSVPETEEYIKQVKRSGRRVFSFNSAEEADVWMRPVRGDSEPRTSSGEEQLLASGSPFPRFDLGLVMADQTNPSATCSAIDGLLRPRGAMHDKSLVANQESSAQSTLPQKLASHKITLTTSRCGNFGRAIEFLTDPVRRNVVKGLSALVTHRFSLDQLPEAMAAVRNGRDASGKKVIKVMVECS